MSGIRAAGSRWVVWPLLMLAVTLVAAPAPAAALDDSRDAPVADAARDGDLDRVRELLRQGADVNASQGDGMTALHWAAERGDEAMADVLLYAGANTEAVTRLGDYTPLHLATRLGRGAVVERLLESGADPEATTATGAARPLHFAAAAGDAVSVAALLRVDADVNAVEEGWGQTPLIFAAARNRLEVVELLLQAGADPSHRSEVVDVPTLASEVRAAGQRRDQVLDAFRAEAGPDAEAWRPDPSQIQAAIRAAWQTPAAGESYDAARDRRALAFRTELGPDSDPTQSSDSEAYSTSYPSLVGGQGGLTALHHAVREGHGDVALALIAAGADLDRVSGGDGTSPLLMATINGHYDLALELLAAGADPDVPSRAGAAPLYAALNAQWAPKARYPQQGAYRNQEATYLDVMRAFLDAGADPNRRLQQHLWYMEYTFSHLGVDTRGATPFWRAAHALDVEAMRLLVEYGADAGVCTIRPPPRRGRPSPAGDLEAPLDPSGLPLVPEGGPGVCPIHAATGHGYGTGYAGNSHRHVPDAWMEAVRYLVEEHGADVNARDHDAYTPLHNAASRGDVEMIRYLTDKGGDVKAVSRRGQTTADMANGPQQRIQPFPEAIDLLVGLGAVNNGNCRSCAP